MEKGTYYQKNKEKRKVYAKEYRSRPEVKIRARRYEQRTDRKARMKYLYQRPESKAKRKKYKEEYYKNNKKKIMKYRQENKEKIRKQQKEHRKKVRERTKKYMKKYRENNRGRIKLQKIFWNGKNKERINILRKGRYKRNKEKINSLRRESYRNYKTNKEFVLKERIRKKLYKLLKKYSKIGKINNSCEYGVDFQVIIEHLKPFPKDIKNYHVDHIIPLCLFDFNNLEHIKKAFAPSNHQWLTKEDNLRKCNKLVIPHQNNTMNKGGIGNGKK